MKDIFTGLDDTSSSPGNFCAMGGVLFFSAGDWTHGAELWKSAGTIMVKDIYAGSISSALKNLTVIGNTLYFQATDPLHGSFAESLECSHKSPCETGAFS